MLKSSEFAVQRLQFLAPCGPVSDLEKVLMKTTVVCGLLGSGKTTFIRQ